MDRAIADGDQLIAIAEDDDTIARDPPIGARAEDPIADRQHPPAARPSARWSWAGTARSRRSCCRARQLRRRRDRTLLVIADERRAGEPSSTRVARQLRTCA